MSNLFDGFPSVLRIGPFDVAVEVKDKIDDRDDDWGSYNHGIGIEFVRSQPSATFALDTAMHEINHGIYRTFGLNQESNEEAVVTAMATGWAMVLRDNPQFVNWLYRMIGAK